MAVQVFSLTRKMMTKKTAAVQRFFLIVIRLSFLDPGVTPSWPGNKLAREDRTGAGFG
jgi:hypothetical protein